MPQRRIPPIMPNYDMPDDRIPHEQLTTGMWVKMHYMPKGWTSWGLIGEPRGKINGHNPGGYDFWASDAFGEITGRGCSSIPEHEINGIYYTPIDPEDYPAASVEFARRLAAGATYKDGRWVPTDTTKES
jgi:hypothetical protein